MKNFQVRLADDLHSEIGRVARSRSISLADIIRESLEVYLALRTQLRSGGRLILESDSGERTMVLIPGTRKKG